MTALIPSVKYKILGYKLEEYALSLADLGWPDCDMDAPDFLVAASMIKKGDISGAIEFAGKLDTDPREYILYGILKDFESEVEDLERRRERLMAYETFE